MGTQKSELAAIFTSMAGLLASRNENPFKVRAYRRASETLRNLSEELSDVIQRGELQTLPGIGKDLAKKIEEYLSTGRIRAYDELRMPLPDMACEWLMLPGFSEPIVHDLFFRLGMRSWDDLEALARSHLLETLPGFSGRSEEVVHAIQQRMAGKDSPLTDRNV